MRVLFAESKIKGIQERKTRIFVNSGDHFLLTFVLSQSLEYGRH